MYRKSVCEGFALAFANVLNRLGIPCGIVTGYSSLDGTFGAHAWNIVELDRKYYHLDVTWDICTKEKEIDTFDYFFLMIALCEKIINGMIQVFRLHQTVRKSFIRKISAAV